MEWFIIWEIAHEHNNWRLSQWLQIEGSLQVGLILLFSALSSYLAMQQQCQSQ